MLVYPAPVLLGGVFTDATTTLCGGFSTNCGTGATPYYPLPAVPCMQPVQAYMHQGMVMCPPLESAEQAPTAQSEEVVDDALTSQRQKQRERKRNAARRGGQARTQNRTTSDISSPTSSQTSTVLVDVANSSSCQALRKQEQRRSKSKKKARRCAALEKIDVSSDCLQDIAESACNLKISVKYDNVRGLGEDQELCNQIIAQLESSGVAARNAFAFVLPLTKPLAFSSCGCRVVQTAIEKGGTDDRDCIIARLQGSIIQLYTSPNANHVVTKMIEQMPPASLGFIVRELEGHAVECSKDQFGCRLLERLLEHFESTQIAGLVHELLADPEPLCRNAFGNFVMQHIFEHGLQTWKDVIVQSWQDIPLLAKHRVASHVVQKALDRGGEKVQEVIVSALIDADDKTSFVEVACSRYGSYVVENLAKVPAFDERVRELLKANLPRLVESQYGKRAICKFGFLPASS